MTKEKLLKIFKSRSFINVKDFIDNKNHIIGLVTVKGTGKSYSALNLCIDEIESGNECAWIRNTEKEIIKSNLVGSFRSILLERNLIEKYIVQSDGVYEIVKKDDAEVKILKIMFLHMSKPLNSASQNALTRCKTIIYDEFINPTFTMSNLHAQFVLLCHTLKRKNIANVFLLGNKHTSENDIMDGFGVEFDWEKKDLQIHIDNAADVQFYFFPDYKVADFDESNEQVAKWSKYNRSLQEFNTGGIAINPKRNVINWERNNIASIFKPMWKFTINRANFILGSCMVNNEVNYYIKEETHASEYPELKYYCFIPSDKEDYNIYISPQEDTDKIEFLINKFNRGILYYSSYFTKESFRSFLPFIRIILKK